MHDEKMGLLIDLKKCRIRIHRNTMKVLGDPEYVMLLVNPEERTIALSKSTAREKRSHKIPAPRKDGRHEYEFYSRGLVQNLSQLNAHWCEPSKYRMNGEYVINESIVVFRMDQAEQIGV
jgi:hypothetical protein